MEYVRRVVSRGFKYSLTASNGIDKTIGFALADSILINYESVKEYVHFKNSSCRFMRLRCLGFQVYF